MRYCQIDSHYVHIGVYGVCSGNKVILYDQLHLHVCLAVSLVQGIFSSPELCSG